MFSPDDDPDSTETTFDELPEGVDEDPPTIPTSAVQAQGDQPAPARAGSTPFPAPDRAQADAAPPARFQGLVAFGLLGTGVAIAAGVALIAAGIAAFMVATQDGGPTVASEPDSEPPAARP